MFLRRRAASCSSQSLAGSPSGGLNAVSIAIFQRLSVSSVNSIIESDALLTPRFQPLGTATAQPYCASVSQWNPGGRSTTIAPTEPRTCGDVDGVGLVEAGPPVGGTAGCPVACS